MVFLVLSWLPVLCNIVLASIRRKMMLKNLISKTNTFPNSLLFDVIQETVHDRLRSRCMIKKLVDEVLIFNLTQAWKD